MARKVRDAELLETLGDFTSKENWDKFFTLRGSEDPFEWYIEWPILQKPLFAELPKDGSPQILVPGCGNSRISEYLYDNGFKNITNIDFSKVVVSDMLRMHIRSRPEMKWRVMDMTSMQFTDGSFDVVLDKGGLDALMEPEHGSLLGSQYLLEVKRVMKLGGKYVCLTLAESHVLGLLFSTFRFGWKTSIHVIPNKSSHKRSFQTFMFVSKKENTSMPTPIGTSFDLSNIDCNGHQGRGLLQALESENKIRNNYSSGADIMYSFNDLQLGAKGDLKEFVPGRRAQLILGGQDDSRFSYEAILLDSQQLSEPFVYHFGVFLVPAIHTTRRNRLEQKRLNDLVYVRYNQILHHRYQKRDNINPISLKDIDDSNEWLTGMLDSLDLDQGGDGIAAPDLVFPGQDLEWAIVSEATGVNEPRARTRAKGKAPASTSNVYQRRGRARLAQVGEEEEKEEEEEEEEFVGKDDDSDDYPEEETYDIDSE